MTQNWAYFRRDRDVKCALGGHASAPAYPPLAPTAARRTPAAPAGGSAARARGENVTVTGSRDRDLAGRPRNARPRDELGRPLPRGSAAGPPPPPDVPREAAASLQLAGELLAAGRPFAAHEVLEAAWKRAPTQERGTWRALAQLAVGVTHAQRGNAAGAVALLLRAADGLAGAPQVGDETLPAEALCTWAADAAAALREDENGALPPMPALQSPPS